MTRVVGLRHFKHYVTMGCVEFNGSSKHIKKIRSSQDFILRNSCTAFQLFPVTIVKNESVSKTLVS